MTSDAAIKTVLVVDDDVLIAMDIAMMVEESGAAVMGPYHKSTEAIAALQDTHPDLAIIDFNLGTHTSEALAQELKAQGIPFVFLTGHTQKHLEKLTQVDRILEKPVSAARIAELLASV